MSRASRVGRVLAAALAFAAAAAAAAAAGDGLFLWEVQGAKARHYLVGSVHLLPPTAYPLPAPIEAAYEATEGVVFESDLAALASPELQGRVLAAAKDETPGGLRKLLKPALLQKLEKRAEALGMPLETCEGFKPWYCALTLELFAVQRVGFDAQYGIDQHFFTKATDDNRPIGWLEDPEVQVTFFTDMPAPLSIDLLAATLEGSTDTSQDPAELLRVWSQGDTTALEKLVGDLKAHHPKIHARLFVERNRDWIPKLVTLFAGDSPQFVVVGAAHFAGPDGLLALLKQRGLTLRQVPAAPARAAAPAAAVPAADPRAPGAAFLSPFLHCRDPEAAFGFYQEVFGFTAATEIRDENGKLQHGELKYRDAVVMLGPEGGDFDQRAPNSGKFTSPFNLYLYVDDLEALVATARDAKAEILQAPRTEPWGDRVAVIRDPEGYLWWIATHGEGLAEPGATAP